MSSAPPGREPPPQNIAAAITEVSERATLLVREEIELAKAELTQKATKFTRGAVVGVVAGVFLLTALFFALIGCAWLAYYFLPVNNWAYFFGFFAVAVVLVVLGVVAGFIAARLVKRALPPAPKMAIEEGRKIREAVTTPPPAPLYGAIPPAGRDGGASGEGS
jgi:MFS family permease